MEHAVNGHTWLPANIDGASKGNGGVRQRHESCCERHSRQRVEVGCLQVTQTLKITMAKGAQQAQTVALGSTRNSVGMGILHTHHKPKT